MTIARPMPNKLTLQFIELGTSFEAYFNPKEISIDKTANWTRHPDPKANERALEFKGANGKTVALELFFDTYERGVCVYETYIARLEKGITVMDAATEDKKHPPKCLISWGNRFPKLTGVMSSLTVKYTMFFSDGTPCRATASIKITEAPPRRRRDADSPSDDSAEERGADRRRRGRSAA